MPVYHCEDCGTTITKHNGKKVGGKILCNSCLEARVNERHAQAIGFKEHWDKEYNEREKDGTDGGVPQKPPLFFRFMKFLAGAVENAVQQKTKTYHGRAAREKGRK
jgi:hypothetical protein